jgi:hypothetical protein
MNCLPPCKLASHTFVYVIISVPVPTLPVRLATDKTVNEEERAPGLGDIKMEGFHFLPVIRS